MPLKAVENLLTIIICCSRRWGIEFRDIKSKYGSNPMIVIGIIAFLKFKISNKRHKTPNPIAINVFIVLFD
jgi:hypothetical protein